MNMKKLNRRNVSPGAAGLRKQIRTMNLYEIHEKIINGKNVSWLENAVYAGFTEDEIIKMIEDNI